MFDLSNTPSKKYDKSKANVLIIKIKKSTKEQNTLKLKKELFLMMNRIIIKNIHNYLKLSNNSPVTEECNNYFEMQSEAYIIMDKCLENFEVNIKNDFYFYFNKSLSRNFYRMFSQTIREKKRSGMVMEFISLFSSNPTNDIDSDVEFLIDQLGFDSREKTILLSKMYNITKTKFLAKNKKFSKEDYDTVLSSVKEKLNKIKQNYNYE